MTDEKGVLGKLPRSRPGHRSDKRAASAGRPSQAAAAPPKRTAAPGRTAAGPSKAARPEPVRPAAQPDPRAPAPGGEGTDPLGEAARTAARAVGAGVRLGAGLAQEVLKRLPRP